MRQLRSLPRCFVGRRSTVGIHSFEFKIPKNIVHDYFVHVHASRTLHSYGTLAAIHAANQAVDVYDLAFKQFTSPYLSSFPLSS